MRRIRHLRGHVLWLLLCCVAACQPETEYRSFSGATMGTVYHVQVACTDPHQIGQQGIEDLLVGVNDLMSTYQSDSVLSRFNRSSPGDWFDVPQPLITVVAAAQHLSGLSQGEYDVTVGPLVNLWGFGPLKEPLEQPSAHAISQARRKVGYQNLSVRKDPPALRKARDLYVDLSSIAKGYGVDVLTDWLIRKGCKDYLVEIGGEVKAHGVNSRGEVWRVGIEVPDAGKLGALQKIIELQDLAVATSGDYRNFVRFGGKRYSHTIDPRTGYPVRHNLASVTVLHASDMWADGYATLLEVLGPQRGYQFAASQGLAALFIERTESGFVEHATPAFAHFLARSGGAEETSPRP